MVHHLLGKWSRIEIKVKVVVYSLVLGQAYSHDNAISERYKLNYSNTTSIPGGATVHFPFCTYWYFIKIFRKNICEVFFIPKIVLYTKPFKKVLRCATQYQKLLKSYTNNHPPPSSVPFMYGLYWSTVHCIVIMHHCMLI